MTCDPWKKAEEFYHAALERQPAEREAFLKKACAGDEALLDEVKSLLGADERAGRFIEEPAADAATQAVSADPSHSWLKRRIRDYEIVSLLGAGGMGEVYRARDTKLGRDVALKVLPRAFAEDSERVSRFEREARLLAALNHPNVASIHGLEESEGRHVLVLELVEGETLAERIVRGPISIAEALPLFRQIAAGLETAHEKGIIHRDLKPANVRITPEGQVKVLDFGLAKAFPGVVAAGSQLDTVSAPESQTGEGRILGTVAYMSPEQARGQAVDKRTDVWAFGCVLYEALTGRRAFSGETMSDTFAAVLDRDVDWEALPDTTPGLLRSLLRRCLRKDRERRLHDIADARIEIEEVLAGQETVEPAAAPEIRRRPAWRRAASWVTTALVVATAAGAVVLLWPRLPPPTVMRFAVSLPPEHRLSPPYVAPIALSPSGTHLVYAAERAGRSQLFLRELDRLEGEPLAGTEGARNLFFSPDGEWVGFFAKEGTLRKVSVTGGSPVTICDVQVAYFCGASWGPDDTITYSEAPWRGMWRVPASGGTPEKIGPGRWPQVLPDGRHLLFSSMVEGLVFDHRPSVLSLKTGESRTFDRGRAGVRYVSSGHLVYGQSGSLMAVPFDLSSLELRGSPRPVLDGLSVHPYGLAHFAVSDDGTLAYVPGANRATLEWVDREGRTTPFVEENGEPGRPRISPDGRTVAIVRYEEGDQWNIWTYDLERGTRTRLTNEGVVFAPAWTPDSKRVTFSRSDELYWTSADGSGAGELLRRDAAPSRYHLHPGAWSPDGRHLAVTDCDPGDIHDQDIWVIPLEGEPWPFVATEHIEGAPTFSPDGRWLAYVSNESGREEVYVQAFPGGGGRWTISTNGGVGPTWSHDGSEVFFRDRSGRTMMAASFVSQPAVRVGAPRRLFEGDYVADEDTCRFYDVTPDGQRFLMIRQPDVRSINIVLNWFEELERLVPDES